MQENKIFKGRRIAAVFLIPFGLFAMGYAVILPFLLKSPLLGFLLMGIPLIFGGIVMLMHGIAAMYAGIEISENELRMVVPVWRAIPILPIRKVSLKWNEVEAVRHRTEIYTIILPIPVIMPYFLEVYAIDTLHGRFVLPDRLVRGLTDAIEEISNRSGNPIQSDGEVSLKLFRCILFGIPAWQSQVSAKHDRKR